MKSMSSAVSLAGVTAALRGSMCILVELLRDDPFDRPEVDPFLLFMPVLFNDTNGSRGPGSLFGPVERMNSAKSRVDSVFILGSRARRPLFVEVDCSIGRLYDGSEVPVFSSLEAVGRETCASRLGGSSFCEDLPSLLVPLLADLLMSALFDTLEGGTCCVLKEPPEIAGG